MEQPIISGVAHDRSEAKVTVVGVPDKPGKQRSSSRRWPINEVHIDMIVQNVSAAATGLTDISFTLPKADAQKAIAALDKAKAVLGLPRCSTTTRSGRSPWLVPACEPTPVFPLSSFERWPNAGVNAEMISTSEIRISVVTRTDELDAAVNAVHTAFGLDADQRGSCLRRDGTMSQEANACRCWCNRRCRHGHARHLFDARRCMG